LEPYNKKYSDAMLYLKQQQKSWNSFRKSLTTKH